MTRIKLGNTVKDKVTGFKGVAIARIEYLNGCVQICVKPCVDKDGKMLDGEYVDIHQLLVVDEAQDFDSKPTGGAMPDAPRERYSND